MESGDTVLELGDTVKPGLQTSCIHQPVLDFNPVYLSLVQVSLVCACLLYGSLLSFFVFFREHSFTCSGCAVSAHVCVATHFVYV